jgi:hypothetical protein
MEGYENASAVSTLADGLPTLRSGMHSHADFIKFLSACLHLLFYARGRRFPESSGILKEYTDFIKDISIMDWRVYGYYQRGLLTEVRKVIMREVQFNYLVEG